MAEPRNLRSVNEQYRGSDRAGRPNGPVTFDRWDMSPSSDERISDGRDDAGLDTAHGYSDI